MNKVLEYFKKNAPKELIKKNIRVYGWKFEYDHYLVSSISKYLFEDLDITENIAPITNTNRDGRKKENIYVCVHDTGDTDASHTASFWSNVVKVQDWELGRYEASFQYVTGNDGIYHNIPDDEVGYHAGDGTKYPYELVYTCVTGENKHPKVTISSDGYYEIDGVKSIVLAPRIHKEKDGKVILDRLATTEDINDQGVRCVLDGEHYYLGLTYFSEGYEKIANRAGNYNSIGIESCINEGSDIYLTWQRTAKLVAKLLLDNNLKFDDVKQHHYFSGKPCPQTIRENGMWSHFMDLVRMEYQILLFKNEGYEIKLKVSSNNIDENGRIHKTNNVKELVKYTISTIKDGVKEDLNLTIII